MPLEPNDFKKYFSLPTTGAYLNCAAQGPLSKPASEAVMRSMHDKENPMTMDHSYGETRVRGCRQAVAKLIDCPPENVALASSTSWGENIVARGLNFKVGDEVLMFEGQFPSNAAPWEPLQERGVKLVKVPCPTFIADLRDLEKAITPRTRIATLEWVHFVSGDRIPLNEVIELCHKKGVLVILDITQGAGAIPFSMRDCKADAVACSAYKWLYSPYGSGFLALSDELCKSLAVSSVNWLSLDTQWAETMTHYEVSFCGTAKRFDIYAQMGHLNIDGMTASIELLNGFDIRKNFQYVGQLIDQLKSELEPRFFKAWNQGAPERQSCIATFNLTETRGEKIVQTLAVSGFAVCIRNGGLRVAPSIYNDSKQISAFCRIANEAALKVKT